MTCIARSINVRVTVASVLTSASTKRVFCISISGLPNALRARERQLQGTFDGCHSAQHIADRNPHPIEKQFAGTPALLSNLFQNTADDGIYTLKNFIE